MYDSKYAFQFYYLIDVHFAGKFPNHNDPRFDSNHLELSPLQAPFVHVLFENHKFYLKPERTSTIQVRQGTNISNAVTGRTASAAADMLQMHQPQENDPKITLTNIKTMIPMMGMTRQLALEDEVYGIAWTRDQVNMKTIKSMLEIQVK